MQLTDKQKKRIIADYVEIGSYSAVSKIHGISATTVRKIVLRSPECVEMCKQKKDQNAQDMLEYLDAKKRDACAFIDKALRAMSEDEKIERTGIQALATSIGIVIDKFTATAPEIEKLAAEIAKLRGEQQRQEVHPLVKDLASAMQKREG